MRIKTFLLLISFCVIAGCSHRQKKIPSLKPDNVKFKFKDSIYVSYVWNIQAHDNSFVINDTHNHRVLRLGPSLNIKKIIGRKGKGPGEFQFAGSIAINNDSLYIYDGHAMRFNIYDSTDHFIRSFHVPYPITNTRIAVVNNKLYMSSPLVPKEHSSIFITNLKGQLIKYFENDSSNPSEINTSTRLLFDSPTTKEIIALSASMPFIERYSLDGRYLGSFDLRKIHALDPLWDSYSKEKSQNTRWHKHTILSDAYMDGTSLYILCEGWPGRDHNAYIIKLAIKSQGISLVSVFKIHGTKKYMDLFSAILVSGDTLIAFDDYTHAICKFDLAKLN